MAEAECKVSGAFNVWLCRPVSVCGLLDSAVCSGNSGHASASSTNNAGSDAAGRRVGLSGAVASHQRAARLQRPARRRLQLLRLQDATPTGQL